MQEEESEINDSDNAVGTGNLQMQGNSGPSPATAGDEELDGADDGDTEEADNGVEENDEGDEGKDNEDNEDNKNEEGDADELTENNDVPLITMMHDSLGYASL